MGPHKVPGSACADALAGYGPRVEGIDPGTGAALGFLQGATEFLPVSSSGHVAIGAMLFGLEDAPLALVVLLHAGTLIATVAALHREVRGLVSESFRVLRRPSRLRETEEGKTLLAIVVASVPTAVIGLAMKDAIESWSGIPWVVGLCLLGSAVAVLSTRRGGGPREVPSLKMAVLIGLAQGLAVLPGLSRSGSTIAVGMMLGLSGPAAFRFSFLVSLPAILGAVILELRDPMAVTGLGVGGIVGGVVALGIGYISLLVLRRLVTQGRFWAFAWYLVPVGVALIVWGLVR